MIHFFFEMGCLFVATPSITAGLKEERYIGVHVRLGDSCVKWQELFKGECISVRQHIAHTRSSPDPLLGLCLRPISHYVPLSLILSLSCSLSLVASKRQGKTRVTLASWCHVVMVCI